MSKKKKGTDTTIVDELSAVTDETSESASENPEKSEKPAKVKPPRKKLRDRFCKKNEVLIILLSLALSFTLFFFSPVEIFIGNQREFVVEFSKAAIPMLLTALASTAAVAIVLNLMLLIHEWVYRVVSRLLFGVLLAGYAQSLFFNSKMASITGDDVNYSSNMPSLIVNLVVFILIGILPLILSIIAAVKPKNKLLNLGKGAVIPYISALIFVMQLVGTGSTMLTTDFSKYKKSYTRYLSYEPSLSLSKEDNVVVFLADRLDSLWMDKAIKKYPDLSERLQGFTFYQNNISHNTNTFPSVPQMLTNCYYKGQEWADYTKTAWEGDTLPRQLTENGYDVNLLIDNLTTYSSIGQIEDQCTNFSECSDDCIKINYFDKGGIVPTMTTLSLAKLSPYIAKTPLTRGMGSNLSQDFVTYTEELPGKMAMSVGEDSDLDYYYYLKKNGLNADNPNKTFTFVHLNFSHGSSQTISALNSDYVRFDKADIYTTIHGAYEIIFEYIDWMKAVGVYDNSTIIIVGDHGRAPSEIEVDDKPGLTSAITTSLLVKPKNAKREELKLDRWSELSNDFFAASVLEYAGIDHKDFGYSYNDIIDNDLHPDRYMQTFDWHGFGSVEYKAHYKVTGDARDFDNWEELPDHE